MNETGMNWRIEPVQAENKTLLYIYDDVAEYGEFNWNTWKYEESETSAKYFAEKLGEIPDGQTIELHINSNGGSVKEGVAIYNLLKQKTNHKVGIVDGVAHSVAFLILQACEERKMCLGTTALIHNMWMQVTGNAAELRKAADDLDKINEAGREAYLEKAGDKLTPEVLARMEDEETWLTAEECIRYGLADRYADQDADMSQATEVLQKANLRMEQRIQVQKSLAAQLRQLLQEYPGAPTPPPEPDPKPKDEINPILKLFLKEEP